MRSSRYSAMKRMRPSRCGGDSAMERERGFFAYGFIGLNILIYGQRACGYMALIIISISSPIL